MSQPRTAAGSSTAGKIMAHANGCWLTVEEATPSSCGGKAWSVHGHLDLRGGGHLSGRRAALPGRFRRQLRQSRRRATGNPIRCCPPTCLHVRYDRHSSWLRPLPYQVCSCTSVTWLDHRSRPFRTARDRLRPFRTVRSGTGLAGQGWAGQAARLRAVTLDRRSPGW